MASKFKFERSDRLDFDEWYSFLNILKEMGIESHYVDIAYEKSKNCFTYDDKNDSNTLLIEFSSNGMITMEQCGKIVCAIGSFRPDEIIVLDSKENFFILRLWWD